MDKTVHFILEVLRTGKPRYLLILLTECEERASILYYCDRFYVPNLPELRTELTRSYHDTAVAGHLKRARTYENLSRDYYWPRMYAFVEQWTNNCHTCRRTTSSREVKQGVLRPLPVPEQAWQDISMDFVVHLPKSDGYDAILVMVCRLTKMKHFIACRDTCGADEVARLYLNNVWKLHGLPKTVISDRGP